ncbi:MAG: hypothetical protein U0931_27065 [Vulcanimicrobiota bacterium]
MDPISSSPAPPPSAPASAPAAAPATSARPEAPPPVPAAPRESVRVSPEAAAPAAPGSGVEPHVEALRENFGGPGRNHNGGPLMEGDPARQGPVPGSSTADPRRGTHQVGENPNVPPMRSQAAANAVISDPLNPGGSPSRVLVSVQQNEDAIRQGRGDPRFAGFEKRVANINGVEVHYQYNPQTGAVTDIKDATGTRPQTAPRPASQGPAGGAQRPGMLSRLGSTLRAFGPAGMLLDAFRYGREMQQIQEENRRLNDPNTSQQEQFEILYRRGLAT